MSVSQSCLHSFLCKPYISFQISYLLVAAIEILHQTKINMLYSYNLHLSYSTLHFKSIIWIDRICKNRVWPIYVSDKKDKGQQADSMSGDVSLISHNYICMESDY